MSERKELAYELFMTFTLLLIVSGTSYMAVNALTGETAIEWMNHVPF